MEPTAWKTVSLILLIGTAVFLVISAFMLLWRGYKSRRVKTGSILMIACAVWLVSFELEFIGATFSAKLFWSKMQYVGIVTVPTAFFVYVLQYASYEKWANRRRVALLSIVPVITLFLVFTNEYHNIMWSNIELVESIPSELDKTSNVGYWIYVVYSYTLMLFGTSYLVRMYTHGHRMYRRQAGILLLAVAVVWFTSMIEILGLDSLLYIDMTPLGVAAAGLIVAWNIVYIRMADIMPVVRGAVIESMSDGVIVLDSENRIMDVNPAAEHLMGQPASSMVGKAIKTVWPHWRDQMDSSQREIALNYNNEKRTYGMSVSPLADWRGHVVSSVVVLHDITDRISLKEKEVLLREIHHRVKNNLQIISSLLNLQSHSIKDKSYADMFKESQDRIRSMALIHEKLYQSKNLARIQFDEYTDTLVHELIRFQGVNTQKIEVKIDVGDISLDIDTAIPCGLIINELVSNALKHAFPDNRSGEITIRVHSVDDKYELAVTDNGVGIPENIDIEDTSSLGLRLVTILAEDQLDGDFSLHRDEGTTVRITFKK
jgi:PAS domain S-box-containing protein